MKSVHLLVFDGFADWEPALALCEVNKPTPYKLCRYDVTTVGFTAGPITSMGGMKILPGTILADVTPEQTALFIVPGGHLWEGTTKVELIDLLQRLHGADVPVAAICGATLELARTGLLKGVRHTSNALAYLKSMVPEYREDEFYVTELAVSDQNIITASGVGSVEFAHEIVKTLGIYTEQNRQLWFDLFKHGQMPKVAAGS